MPPSLAWEEVVAWLPLPYLAGLLVASRRVREAVDTPISWKRVCIAVWSDKVYVPAHCQRLLATGDARLALRRSFEDLRRAHITREELCDFVWWCRMKGSAGKSWTRQDPWWNGWAANRRKFAADGTLLVPDESKDGVWQAFGIHGGTSCRWYFASWVPEWAGESPGGGVRQPKVSRVPDGSRVKIDNYPTHLVWRHPMNWGFVLDSPWSVMTSFELPSRHALKHGSLGMKELAGTLTDARLRNNVDTSALECDFYKNDIHVPRIPPLREHFFARRDEDGDVEFCIRSEAQDWLDEECEGEATSSGGEQAEEEVAVETSDIELDGEEGDSTSWEEDVEDDEAIA